MSIRSRLALVLLALAAACALNILAAFWGLNGQSAALDTIHADRVVPLRDLKLISDAYAVSIVDASHKVRNGNWSWAQARDSVDGAQRTINAAWTRYIGTVLTAEEARLVREAKDLKDGVDRSIRRLIAILGAEDRPKLDVYVKDELYQVTDPVTEKISELIELQVRVAEEVHGDASVTAELAEQVMVGLALASLAAIIFGLIVVSRQVSAPLSAMELTMRRMAKGDYEGDIPSNGVKNEIGRMATAVAVFKENGLARRALEEEVKRRQREAEQNRRAMLDHVAERAETDMGSAVHTVLTASGGIVELIERTAERQEASATGAMDMAGAADQTRTRLQGLAAAVEEMTAAIAEISRQVSSTAMTASGALAEVDAAAQQICELVNAAERIGQVAELIRSIANQTNLLALNATIEAARAGEAGRGFAVVANDVKLLANQTEKATGDISRHIEAIQRQTGTAAAAFARVRQVMGEINDSATGIAAAVEEQSAVTQDFSSNLAGVNDEVAQVTDGVVRISRKSIEIGANSIEVLWSAEELKSVADGLGEAVKRFAAGVRG